MPGRPPATPSGDWRTRWRRIARASRSIVPASTPPWMRFASRGAGPVTTPTPVDSSAGLLDLCRRVVQDVFFSAGRTGETCCMDRDPPSHRKGARDLLSGLRAPHREALVRNLPWCRRAGHYTPAIDAGPASLAFRPPSLDGYPGWGRAPNPPPGNRRRLPVGSSALPKCSFFGAEGLK